MLAISAPSVVALLATVLASLVPAHPPSAAAADEPHAAAGDTWVQLDAPDDLLARIGATTIWTGEEIVYWGGHDGSNVLGTGKVFDPATSTWRSTATADAPTPRVNHAAVWTGSAMIVWGGRGPSGNLNTGGIYDPVTDTWETIGVDDAPQARSGHSMVWTGEEIIVWGGTVSVSGSPLPVNSGGVYNPSPRQWRATTGGLPVSTSPVSLPVLAPSPRAGHVAAWTGERMLIWGGSAIDPTERRPVTGGMYDPVQNLWEPMSTDNAALPEPVAAAWTGEELVVAGWYYGPDLQIKAFDPDTNRWATLHTDETTPYREWPVFVTWTGPEFFLWGGGGRDHMPLGTGGFLDPHTGSWREVTTEGAPTPRMGGSVVWTGSELVLYGGYINYEPYTVYDDVFVYTVAGE